MLLSVTGASGVGKSTVLAALTAADWKRRIRCVEFDSIGVPDGADTGWRHAAVERWVRVAIDAQDAGEDVILFGQVPPGELLAAPSADRLDGIAVCVLTSSPEVQRARLIGRGEAPDGLIDHLRFGAWFVQHAKDPAWAPEVIQVDTEVPMRWDRWADWRAGDPRWAFTVIDTDDLGPAQVARLVQGWARDALDRKIGVRRVT